MPGRDSWQRRGLPIPHLHHPGVQDKVGIKDILKKKQELLENSDFRPVSPKAELSTVGLPGLVFYSRQFQFVPERRRQS